MRTLVLVVVLLAAGCLGSPEATPSPPANVQTDDASLRPVTESFSGTATGTPAQPGVYDFPFEVPSAAVGVNGSLTWTDPVARFQLELLDRDGEVVAEGYPDVSGALVVATIEPPKPGTWTFRVTSELAVNAGFALDVAADLIVPEHNVIEKRVTIGQRGFYEINLILEGNASFMFAFNASQPVRWDIHSHPPEGLKEWQTGEGTSGSASFTAPAREVYSVLWENTAALPADVDLRVDGRFRVHSHGG